jgi:Zn finger protein HypA/HybF involved in hydrogenase expression
MERVCESCRNEMIEGFVVETEKERYYCSQKCLEEEVTPLDYAEMNNDGIAYWTDWYDEENEPKLEEEIKMNRGQEVVTCGKCGSNKVQPVGGKGMVIFTGLLTMGVGAWIPIIGWFLIMPVGFLILIGGIISLFFKAKSKRFKCLECKQINLATIEAYEAFKAF